MLEHQVPYEAKLMFPGQDWAAGTNQQGELYWLLIGGRLMGVPFFHTIQMSVNRRACA